MDRHSNLCSWNVKPNSWQKVPTCDCGFATEPTDNNEICYSEDGETFHSDYCGVMDDVHNRGENEVGDTVVIYQGITVPRSHDDYLDTGQVIDVMHDRAGDDLSDYTDGYLEGFTPELEDDFKRHILAWLNVNLPQPTFHGVRDVKPINVVLDS